MQLLQANTLRLAALLGLCRVGLVFARDLPTRIKIDSGEVVGAAAQVPETSATVNKFLGIPFASSPPERFSSPKGPASWQEPLQATAFKPACVQQFTDRILEGIFNNPPAQESEDCLYLNVFAPSSPPPDGGRAVLFWIYGGAFENGHASNPNFEGSRFAADEDIIVITHNYRTNVFGFPGSPELPVAERNPGFLDQRAALQWVQRNIQAFGGDPKKVTIFGESAGAFSVDSLVTSFAENPPFRAAIMQSGQYTYRLTPPSDIEPSWADLAKELECSTHQSKSDLACIRAETAEDIRKTIFRPNMNFEPVIDGFTLVENRFKARSQKNVAQVPILSGTTADDGGLFVLGERDVKNYVKKMFSQFPDLHAAIEEAYPVGRQGLGKPKDVVKLISTEFIFQCPQALVAQATADMSMPSWRYLYDPKPLGLETYHAAEIPIVFGTYDASKTDERQRQFSSFMRRTWANFAKDPEKGPGWDAIGGAGNDVAVLGHEPSQAKMISRAELDKRCAVFQPIYDAVTA